jgi:hypothetical protein
MHTNRGELHTLAARVEQGDAAAAARLRQRLGPELVRIVGRALHAGGADSPLARRIVARAARLDPDAGRAAPAERDRLVGPVAEALCQSVLDRLRDRPAAARRLAETVRA